MSKTWVADQIDSAVRKVITEHLHVGVGEVTMGKTLPDLGADSLDQVEVCMAVEQEFDIEIEDDEFDAACTVGGYIALVRAKLFDGEAT